MEALITEEVWQELRRRHLQKEYTPLNEVQAELKKYMRSPDPSKSDFFSLNEEDYAALQEFLPRFCDRLLGGEGLSRLRATCAWKLANGEISYYVWGRFDAALHSDLLTK